MASVLPISCVEILGKKQLKPCFSKFSCRKIVACLTINEAADCSSKLRAMCAARTGRSLPSSPLRNPVFAFS